MSYRNPQILIIPFVFFSSEYNIPCSISFFDPLLEMCGTIDVLSIGRIPMFLVYVIVILGASLVHNWLNNPFMSPILSFLEFIAHCIIYFPFLGPFPYVSEFL